MQPVSEDMIREIYARSAEANVVLVTIEAAGLDAPIRASSDPDGTESRGDSFPYFPFTFAWGGAGQDETSRRATIKIGNTDGAIAYAIRTAEGQPLVKIEVVRRSDPDLVEIAMIGAKLVDADVDDPTVSGSLKPKSFADEPACAPRYIIARTPGLF